MVSPKTQRLSILSLAFALLVTLPGCFTPYLGIYSDYTSPAWLGLTTNYQITPRSQFKVLGEVEGEASYVIILGVTIGEGGFDAAYKNALMKVPGADALIDIRADRKVFNFLGIFSTFGTKITAKAIKYTPEEK